MLLLQCMQQATNEWSTPHVVIANTPGAQFAAIVQDVKAKQCGASWEYVGIL